MEFGEYFTEKNAERFAKRGAKLARAYDDTIEKMFNATLGGEDGLKNLTAWAIHNVTGGLNFSNVDMLLNNSMFEDIAGSALNETKQTFGIDTRAIDAVLNAKNSTELGMIAGQAAQEAEKQVDNPVVSGVISWFMESFQNAGQHRKGSRDHHNDHWDMGHNNQWNNTNSWDKPQDNWGKPQDNWGSNNNDWNSNNNWGQP